MATRGKSKSKSKSGSSSFAVPVPQKRYTYRDTDYTLGGYGPPKTHHRKESIIRAEGEDDNTVSYGLPRRRSGVNESSGTMDRVIASGAVEAGVFVLGAAASAWFVATRTRDIYWALGLGAAAFFVAGGARNNAAVRDVSLGVLSGSASVATLRAVGKLNKSAGQQ